MIKSSLEFYPQKGRRSARETRTIPYLRPFPSSSSRGWNVALSSIVLSRRCGLVCAKSSEIIDTSSSTLATWSSRDAISFFHPCPLYVFRAIPFIESPSTCLPISCLFTGYDRSSQSDNPNRVARKCIFLRAWPASLASSPFTTKLRTWCLCKGPWISTSNIGLRQAVWQGLAGSSKLPHLKIQSAIFHGTNSVTRHH